MNIKTLLYKQQNSSSQEFKRLGTVDRGRKILCTLDYLEYIYFQKKNLNIFSIIFINTNKVNL